MILLRQSTDDCPPKLLGLLSDSLAASQLRAQLSESLDLNKKLLEELEQVVRRKIEDEDELYTKFRVLLNKYKSPDII